YLWLVFTIESGEQQFYGLFGSARAADEVVRKIVGAQTQRIRVVECGHAEELLPMIARAPLATIECGQSSVMEARPIPRRNISSRAGSVLARGIKRANAGVRVSSR